MEIKEILKKHKKWLNGEEGGERADFSGVDFSREDFSGANFREAVLYGVDFSGANFREAVLYGVDFCGADLSGADLSGANLCKANLRGVNLYGANLSGANLREADLSGAILRGVNLRGANLSMAKNLLSAITYIKDNFKTTDKGIIAYKTFRSEYNPPEKWVIQPGSIITENCNMNRTDVCGCGINVAPLTWVRENYIGDIWMVLIRWEWLCGVCVPYNTDGKIRCEMAELVEIVEDNEINDYIE